MHALHCTEGVPFSFGAEADPAIRTAAARLRTRLKPSFEILREDSRGLTIQGIVGSVRLSSALSLEIEPKTASGDDWIPATLDLLLGTSRLDIGAERRTRLAARRRDLLEVMAAVYKERLEGALRRDGPLLVIERHGARLPVLKGRLDTSAWARSVLSNPATFPVSYDQLTSDNRYSRVLAFVARVLAHACRDPQAKGALLSLARRVRPSAPESTTMDLGVVWSHLPSQWASYEPAWSVARAILGQRGLFGAAGQTHGLEVVLEAWPLLETLLERTLIASANLATNAGRKLQSGPRGGRRVLAPSRTGGSPRSVFPDGVLSEGSRILATFEAKYSASDFSAEWPQREHVFQALSTAAAWGSPIAVLVFPRSFEPVWWDVRGFSGTPNRLVAIGIGLFSYRSGVGDAERGTRILNMLKGPAVA
jgi:hypothetical protein